MSTKWKKDSEKPSTQESEDSMSQALADLGMLEQGMSLQDKRDLLNVIRLSKKSAEAEEEERKTKDKDDKNWSPSPKKYTAYQTLTKEEYSCSKQRNGIMETNERDIFSNISLTVTNSNLHNSSYNKEHLLPASIEYFECGNAAHNGGSDSDLKVMHVNSPNSDIFQNNKISETGNECNDSIVSRQEQCEDDENNTSQREHLGLTNDNELEILPSSVKLKQKDLNGVKKNKDDRERNIDVFSHSSGSSNHNFIRRNMKKNQERVPFYFVPEGMNLRNYVSYFKCYINQYYKKLGVIQQNNIERLEWGAPITLEMSSSFTNFRSCPTDPNGDSASKRYNLRDRCLKPKLVDFTSENSEDAEEDESNDEDIFVPKHKKLPGIKLSTKRKYTSVSGKIFMKKEKKEPPFKKLQDDVSIEDGVEGDIQSSDNPDKIISKARGAASSRKRTRKSRSKLLESENEISEDVDNVVSNVAITSIIEPVIVIAEGPSMESTPSQLHDLSNQPSPLIVKQRRLQLQSKNNGRVNRRKSEPRKNPDIVVVDEEVRPTTGESMEGVRCPICWNSFPASDIEEHASECNQYSPDSSCPSAKV